MKIRQAEQNEFEAVCAFYWDIIDLMEGQTDTVGWQKGVYPDDAFLQRSISEGNLYLLEREGKLLAAVILNSEWNDGYNGQPWSKDLGPEELLVPHALGVHPSVQRQGIGKSLMNDVMAIACERGKKAVRLDVLRGNTAAEKLYTSIGFRYVGKSVMYYPDTGWAEFLLYEKNL